MVLVWQFGSVMLLTLLGSLGGRRLMTWPKLAVAFRSQQAKRDVEPSGGARAASRH